MVKRELDDGRRQIIGGQLVGGHVGQGIGGHASA
jgi:hypothetical protein